MSFAKAQDPPRLAQMAALRRGGVNLEDICAEFDVSHRTAQRMTEALDAIFANVTTTDDAERRRYWRLDAPLPDRLQPRQETAMAAAFLQPQRPLQVKQGSWNYLDPGTRPLCEHSVQGLTCNRSHRAGKPRRRKTALRARRRPAFQSEGPGLRPRHGRRWKKDPPTAEGHGAISTGSFVRSLSGVFLWILSLFCAPIKPLEHAVS